MFDNTKSFENQSEDFKTFAMTVFSNPEFTLLDTGKLINGEIVANDKIIRALRFDGDLVFEVTQFFTSNTHTLEVYTIDYMIEQFNI